MQSAISLYALVMAASMITGSKLGSRHGYRRMFVLGAVVYGAGALVTALSPGLPVMLLGWSLLRGSARRWCSPTSSPSPGCPSKAPSGSRALSLVGAAAGIGAGLGPIVGGAITVAATWRLSFLLEVVVTLLVAAAMFRLVEPRPGEPRAPFDLTGVALSALGMVLIVLGILLASTYGLLRARKDFAVLGVTVLPKGGLSPTVLLVVLGLVVLVGFAAWERRRIDRREDPLVHLAVLRPRATRVGSVALGLRSLFTAGLMFVVPVYLQTALGYDALRSGVTLLPVTVALIAASVVVARLVGGDRIQRRTWCRPRRRATRPATSPGCHAARPTSASRSAWPSPAPSWSGCCWPRSRPGWRPAGCCRPHSSRR